MTLAALTQAGETLEKARDTWHTTMARTLDDLGELLWKPLAPALAGLGARRLVLVPQGGLFLLPLHAAPCPDGRLALEVYPIAYAPSAAVWSEVQARSGPALEGAPLLVANPSRDLPYTPSEALALTRLLELPEPAVLWEDQATLASLLAALPGKTLFHYSGHAAYHWLLPEESSLLLAGGDTLTLAQIQASRALAGNRLTVLSACETGLSEMRRGLADEYVGLPAALLEAGAAGVIASLWSVSDISTSLLMIRFYRHVLGKEAAGRLPPAEALREAQRWLRAAPKAKLAAEVDWLEGLWRAHDRDLPLEESPAYRRGYMSVNTYLPAAREFIRGQPADPPFSHPVWWAGFQAVGSVW